MHKDWTLKGLHSGLWSLQTEISSERPTISSSFTLTSWHVSTLKQTTGDGLPRTLVSLFNTSACLVCSDPSPAASKEFCSKTEHPPREEPSPPDSDPMVDVCRFGARLLPSPQSADVKARQRKLKMTFYHRAASRGRRWLTEDCCLVPGAVKCSEMPATERGPVCGVWSQCTVSRSLLSAPVGRPGFLPLHCATAAGMFLSLSLFSS